MNVQAKPNRDFSKSREHNKRKFSGIKPQKWSHERELEQAIGKEISFDLLGADGTDMIRGVLLAADKYTIKVRLFSTNPIHTPDRVFYKSALTSFAVVTAEGKND